MKVPRGRSYKHAKSAGKGSAPRPVNGEQYRKNFDAIFNKPLPSFKGRSITGTVYL